MLPIRADLRRADIPEPEIDDSAVPMLNFLRLVSMSCRAKPRADLFEACALLQVSRAAKQEAYADALMRCLGEALGQPARLYAPGVAEMTFDERWLVQLGLASARGDAASLRFLLASRIARKDQRLISFLISRISECFVLI